MRTRLFTLTFVAAVACLAVAAQPRASEPKEISGKVNYFIGNDPQTWRRDVPVQSPARVRIPPRAAQTGPLAYSTYLGGTGQDSGNAIASDPSGNIYIAGTTFSPDFPATAPSFMNAPSVQGQPQGQTSDVFVAKFNPQGGLIYCTYLGGSGSDSAAAIAVDRYGNAYVTGSTPSADFPTTPGALFDSSILLTPSRNRSIFVTKLNAAGNSILYSTLLGSGGLGDAGTGIAVDAAGNAYVTGRNQSVELSATPGAMQPVTGAAAGSFLAKINPAGTRFVYVTGLTLPGDAPSAVAIDAAGNAYVTGSSYDIGLRGPGAFQSGSATHELSTSIDGGNHWTLPGPGLENMIIETAAWDQKNGALYAAGTAGVFKSANRGASWTVLADTSKLDGFAVLVIALDPGDSQHLLAIAGGDRLYGSRDGGATWHSTGTRVTSVVFDPSRPNNVYGTNFNGFTYSRDGGETWSTLNTFVSFGGGAAFYWGRPILDPSNPNTIYTVVSSGVVKSVDAGKTWSFVTQFQQITAVAVDPKNSSVLYGAEYDSIMKSVDGGLHWNQVSVSPYSPVSGLIFDALNPGTLYVLTPYGVLRSTDGAATLQPLSSMPLNPSVNSLLFDSQHPGTIYALSAFVPDAFLTAVSADGTTALFSTYFGGSGSDTAAAIGLDGSGSIYIAGTTTSPDLAGAQQSFTGFQDAFLAKFSKDGSQLSYTKLIGGSLGTVGFGLAVDIGGNVSIAGATASPDFPLTSDALQNTVPANGSIGFFAKLDAAGNPQTASYFGGTLGDRVTAAVFDPSGRLCITGTTQSPDFKTTLDAVQPLKSGLGDAFLAMINLGR